ncbi:OmpA family protein [Sagittula stellata]|uniref:OmpA domain protein n=1 Tax=Sagittula stellata (strain ATCC 700073 / DSM 11524 / E-37) TaxID=388399 RepID=A3K530_SAGS3|nr:OmpA family protein [Sagittula stellata]EBA07631.1 OmpA domain protein [Sagittula stellata E-37]
MNITRRRADTRRRLAGLAVLVLLCGPARALDLPLPGSSEQTFDTVQDPGVYALPTGPWADDALPTRRIEGRIEVSSWRVPKSGLTSFQLLKPLRDALVAEGFEIVLDCAAAVCGGFDFRFATLVVPAPEMFVSLDDFRFVSAVGPEGGAVSVLTSRGPSDGYVQVIRAGQDVQAEITRDAPALARTSGAAIDPGDIPAALERDGHVTLSDLVFRSGSTDLGGDDIASLDALAQYLSDNPTRRILFVGHTDATGSLEANRGVSLRRAQAAVAYLRSRHDTDAGRIGAEGAGYLAPVASNLTAEGREANRRVEAVLISTE